MKERNDCLLYRTMTPCDRGRSKDCAAGDSSLQLQMGCTWALRLQGRTSIILLSPFKLKDVTSSQRLKTKFESQDDFAIKVEHGNLKDIHLLWGT